MEGKEYDEVPFDLYCPSVQEKLANGIWKLCNRYWPSKATMIRHKKCHRKLIENELEMESKDSGSERESELDEESSNYQNNGEEMSVFRNIFDILASPFIEEV